MNPRDIRSPVALVLNAHHALRRALCERIRASFANIRILEAVTIDDALYMLDAEHIDVVLIDGDRSGVSGLTSTRAILERSPGSSVVVMSALTEPSCHDAASRAGAMAFVNKRAIGSDLMQVLGALIEEHRAKDRDAP